MNTSFLLGAGASNEVRMPIGTGAVDHTASRLRFGLAQPPGRA